jgi:hypothetical protein
LFLLIIVQGEGWDDGKYFFKLYKASFTCCSLISNCFSYFIFTHLQPQQIQYLFSEFSSSKGDFSIVSVT